MGILIILLELVFLYVLSRRMTQNIYTAVFLLTKSRTVGVSLLSILFFPGTVIHELAHMFVAEILGVHTSGLTLSPEGLENPNVRTGSVSIAQSDPFRRAIIGIAPIFVGLAALGTISYFIPQEANWIRFGLGYLLFAVSNTMFSSPEDMEGFWPVAIVVTLVGAALYFIGIRINLTDTLSATTQNFFTAFAVNLGWIVALNVGLFILSRLLITLIERLTHRRLVRKAQP